MARLLFVLFVLVSAHALLGCGGCSGREQAPVVAASAESAASPANAPTPEAAVPPADILWKLTPNARSVYYFLLLDLAMRRDEEAKAVQALSELTLLPDIEPRLFLEGVVWLLARKSRYSFDVIDKALAAYPDDISLHLLNAEALLEYGRAEKALDHMREFSAQHPEVTEAKTEFALLLVKLGRAREAESLLAALPQTERSVAVEYYHGKALKGLNRPKEALRRFQAAAALASPDFPQAGLELARLYEELGERKKARKTREGMLKRKNNPETVLLLALLAAESGDQEHAMALVRKGPATPDFLFSAVRVFMEGRQWKPAESLLKELLKRPETNGNMREVVYANLAKIALVDRGDHKEALRLLENIPPDSEGYELILPLKLQLLGLAGKNEEALPLLRQERAKHPERQDLLRAEIRLLNVVQRHEEALAIAENALRERPDDADLAFLRASLLDEQGRKQEAFAAMEAIALAQPEHYQVLNYLGYTLAEENRELQRALELLLKAAELAPDRAYIIDSLAWAQYRLGKFETAWENIRRATSLDGNEDPTIWEHYGDIAAAVGNAAEARKGYGRALELKTPNAESVRERLSKL